MPEDPAAPRRFPHLNCTESFYRSDHPSLFWELTVCQSLALTGTPYQAALERPAPYGVLIARYLARMTRRREWGTVVEVGGGYGSLMSAFLEEADARRVVMVDVSPRFLHEQRKALQGVQTAVFEECDATAYFRALPEPVDLVIANEVLGDFPTVTGLRSDAVRAALEGGAADPLTRKVAEKVGRYRLDLSGAPDPFAFNLGAVEFLEALAGRARVVFLTEHSADPVLPERYAFLPLPDGSGFPRRIPLKDHDEYTVKFGHLEAVARHLGFRVHRFHLAEVVGLRADGGIRSMVQAGVALSDATEAVIEFCAHIPEYEGVVLVAPGGGQVLGPAVR